MSRFRHPGTVRIKSDALATAVARARTSFPEETGGILLGYRADGVVIVERFLEVSDEKASRFSYRRAHMLAEAALSEALTSEHELSLIGYVGEWHSHPAPGNPSPQDIKELRRISRGTSHPIALVVLAAGEQSWIPRACVARMGSPQRAKVEVFENLHLLKATK